MAARPTWKGFLKVSLVNIPIKVFPATESSGTISFNQLHGECQTRIQQKRWCPRHNREVPASEIVKGYEFEKGRYVVLTEEDFDKVRPASTQVIDLVHALSTFFRVTLSKGQDWIKIAEEIERVLERFSPTALSLEKSFVASNVQTAFRLGEARGAVLAVAARSGIPIGEYSPAEIKRAVVGTGRASKEQVQEMVRRLLALSEPLTSDQADALAVALCHLQARRVGQRVGTDNLVELIRSRRRRSGRRWTSLAGIDR